MATQASLGTRVKVFWGSLPAITRSIFLICTTIYVGSLLLGWDNLGLVCLGPYYVIQRVQLWRLLTAALFHAGLLHITFNMMAFLSIGASLERAMGSFQLGYLIALLIAAGDGVYIGAAFLAGLAGFPALMSHCAVGFSGVIFGLIPVESRYSSATQRSFFGLFSVPTAAYPWVLLVLWQVLIPQSSFLGHLSGLAVGQLYALGMLRWVVPTAEWAQQAERSAPLAWCMASAAWIANTGSDGSSTGGGGVLESLLPITQPRNGSGYVLDGSWMQKPWAAISSLFGRGQGDTAAGDQSSNGSAAPAGPAGRVVGGVAPVVQEPKAAAAAAAEARVGGNKLYASTRTGLP